MENNEAYQSGNGSGIKNESRVMLSFYACRDAGFCMLLY